MPSMTKLISDVPFQGLFPVLNDGWMLELTFNSQEQRKNCITFLNCEEEIRTVWQKNEREPFLVWCMPNNSVNQQLKAISYVKSLHGALVKKELCSSVKVPKIDFCVNIRGGFWIRHQRVNQMLKEDLHTLCERLWTGFGGKYWRAPLTVKRG